jgi:AraC-like DNA-binding protein
VVRYREIRPSARLRSFVNAFWILEQDGHDAAQQRVVPDGHSELILNWGQPFEAFQDGQWRGQPRCFLAGQIDGPLVLRPKGSARMLGIGFHPHGAARIFAQPMHQLAGRFTPLEDLSKTLSRSLEEALESPDAVTAVETALFSAEQASRGGDQLIAEAVRRLTLANGSTDIASLAGKLGLSVRQLERRFAAAVGLPPKVFCRIQRFTNVFRVLGKPSCDWVETAISCGYYDQAHLIRDCRHLSGSTPAILLAEDADLARHFYRRFGMSHSSNTTKRV